MKVLLLAWDFPPTRGGIQTWMFELSLRLPDAEVQVLAPWVPGARAFDRHSGVRVSRLGSAPFGRLAWLLELCSRTLWHCLVGRPDVIVCGHYIAAPAGLLAWRFFHIPYVVFAYGHEVRRKGVRRLQQFLLKPATLVIACSRFTRSAVVDLGVTPDRARVLYPGVDAQRFSPFSEGTNPTRSRTLLTVSRLTDFYKGHDTVIRALPAILAELPGVRYVVAGDGPLREPLTKLANSLGVSRDVEFTGEVSDETIIDLYRSCEVFVLVSRECAMNGGAEGFGIVFLEAAACAKPVVAGRSGGIVDAVQDEVTGLLVDPEDVDAVAAAIVSLFEDPPSAKRLGDAGREMVLARFTWDHVMRDARKLLEGVAAPRN